MNDATEITDDSESPRLSWWWVLGLAALVALLIGSVGWCFESWMFPENACRIPEWVWISCAVAGTLGLVVFAICHGSSRHRWHRTAFVLAFASAMIAGFRLAGREFAVGQLFHSREIPSPYIGPNGWLPTLPDSITQKLVKWLDA